MENQSAGLLHKFVDFIEFHQIEAMDIWEGKQWLVPTQFFNKVEELTGKQLSIEESSAIFKLSTNADQSLQVKHFQVLGLWLNESSLVSNDGTKIGIENKYPSLKKKERPQSGAKFRKKTSERGSKKDEVNNLITTQSRYHTIDNCHTSSIMESNMRIENAESKLQRQITQNTLDKKWGYLFKVSEMNSWINLKKDKETSEKWKVSSGIEEEEPVQQQQEKGEFYRIYGEEEEIVIMGRDDNGEDEVVPLKVFDRKYQSLKKKFTEEPKEKNNMKGTMFMVLEQEKQRFSKTKLNEKIGQRDQELNYLLLEIIRMKNMMEQQEKILNDCGINV